MSPRDTAIRSNYTPEFKERTRQLPTGGPRDPAPSSPRDRSPITMKQTKRNIIADAIRKFGNPMTPAEIWEHSSRRIGGTRKQFGLVMIGGTNDGFFIRRTRKIATDGKPPWEYLPASMPWPEAGNTDASQATLETSSPPITNGSTMDQAEAHAATPSDAADLAPSSSKGPDGADRPQDHDPNPRPVVTDPLVDLIHGLPILRMSNQARHVSRLYALADWMTHGGDDEVAEWLLELAVELEMISHE